MVPLFYLKPYCDFEVISSLLHIFLNSNSTIASSIILYISLIYIGRSLLMFGISVGILFKTSKRVLFKNKGSIPWLIISINIYLLSSSHYSHSLIVSLCLYIIFLGNPPHPNALKLLTLLEIYFISSKFISKLVVVYDGSNKLPSISEKCR